MVTQNPLPLGQGLVLVRVEVLARVVVQVLVRVVVEVLARVVVQYGVGQQEGWSLAQGVRQESVWASAF